ncbi:putative solute carrier family 22 member 31 [Sinocyclocheilus rhinocerous]|uniref:putative solute carrier family 22 member 31 n=1 Tax=Sinocyclocheilus rhinocerous TaxID=307959 RepID=UPI0007B98253|nr:PREDICTED: putative solute carrier family 22 member 31 [Sinocyclocheilus rhinocerous]
MNRTSLCYLTISPCMRGQPSFCSFPSSTTGSNVCEKQLFPSTRTLVMEFESKIYPQIGGYGRYNRIITLFSWFPNFAVSLNLLSDVFFTLIPESYHCNPDLALLPPSSLLGNLSRQASLNLTTPWLKGSGFSHCELYKYPLNMSSYTENVPRDVVPCTRGWEYGKPAGLQNNLVTEWDLVCANYWKIPLQHICFMTGWTLGYILLGTMCDWLGRRCALLLSVVLSGLLGIMACLSNSPSAFPFLRLCQGSTLAGVFLSSYIARLEWCDPPHRLMVSMVSGFFAVFAELLLPGLAVLCRDWPVLQAVATLPLLLLLSYWCCASVFPESPRWLIATSQISQAKKCLQSFSARNGMCVSDELYPAETLLSDLHGGLVLVLSVVGLLSSQALAMLSVFFGSEVMPTVVRGGTLGLIMAAGCVGMAASSLMELQNNGGYFLHHVIFASFAVLSVLCIMLLPESKHKPLPDSLKDGERQRRPPLFLSRINRDNPPLLRMQPQSSEYNRDNYSRLVTATKKMLTTDALPYKISISPQAPLLASNGTAPDANDDSS